MHGSGKWKGWRQDRLRQLHFLVYDLANIFVCPKSECKRLVEMCYDLVGSCPEYNKRIALVVGTDVHYDCKCALQRCHK